MRKNNLYLAILLALVVMPWSASAEEAKVPQSKAPQPIATPADAVPLEDIPPPPVMGTDENVDEPEITIVKKKGETIEEYRINGQLYMMKVTPSHGVPYYLHKEDQDGGWVNSGPNPPQIMPKWILFRF